MKSTPIPTSIELRQVDALVPYARNARTHTPEQVAQIAGSIREFGWTNPVLIAEDGTIIAGHGRVLAARKLGMAEVPCIVLEHLTETQRRALVLADNRLALSAGWDEELLALELLGLKDDGFELPVIGFDADELAKLLADGSSVSVPEDGDTSLSEKYTKKIQIPIYEPTGPCPPVDALYDDHKAAELVAQVRTAGLPADVEAFLCAAASRHTVFDFRMIAEFYAHAAPELQRLMEASALVIIDYGAAVENGFVRLTKALGELADIEDAANGS